jgi:hypothetical protein
MEDFEPTASEAAIWLQGDAEYLYRLADQYRDNGNTFMATVVQNNAAHSANEAREYAALAA